MNTPLHRFAMLGTLALLALLIVVAACEKTTPDMTPQTSGHDMHAMHGSAATPAAPLKLDGPGKGNVFNFSLKLDPPEPALGTMFKVEATVTDLEGKPVTNARVRIDATMPEHGHGMTTQPEIKELGEGRYVAEGMKLHMPGRWVLLADADASAQGADNVSFEYPQSPRASTR